MSAKGNRGPYICHADPASPLARSHMLIRYADLQILTLVCAHPEPKAGNQLYSKKLNVLDKMKQDLFY